MGAGNGCHQHLDCGCLSFLSRQRQSGAQKGDSDPYIAARSVHVWWRPQADDVVAFYNEVYVEKTTPGSYFMTCGFDGGYFGIQEMCDGAHRVLFSVWDASSEMNQGRDEPCAIALEERVQILHGAPDVEVRRFGGEGTGAQCLDDATGWTLGTKVCCLVEYQGCPGGKACYAAFVKPAGGTWKHLASYCVACGKPFRGFYSFIEDFRRDRSSVLDERRAQFGPAWLRSAAGDWSPATAARFTGSGADWERPDNIDSRPGTAPGTFVLATGGAELGGAHKLLTWTELEAGQLGPPVDLPMAGFPTEGAVLLA